MLRERELDYKRLEHKFVAATSGVSSATYSLINVACITHVALAVYPLLFAACRLVTPCRFMVVDTAQHIKGHIPPSQHARFATVRITCRLHVSLCRVVT